MTLEEFNYIAEIIASIAVIGSLLYVALEVRQNTRGIKLSAGNYAAEQARTVFLRSIAPDTREIVYKAWQDPESVTGIDRFAFFGLMHDHLCGLENVYYQHRDGAIDPRLWQGLVRRASMELSLPGCRYFWDRRKNWYSDAFQSFIDELVATKDGASFKLGDS